MISNRDFTKNYNVLHVPNVNILWSKISRNKISHRFYMKNIYNYEIQTIPKISAHSMNSILKKREQQFFHVL